LGQVFPLLFAHFTQDTRFAFFVKQ
jgi:hypothetical protein